MQQNECWRVSSLFAISQKCTLLNGSQSREHCTASSLPQYLLAVSPSISTLISSPSRSMACFYIRHGGSWLVSDMPIRRRRPSRSRWYTVPLAHLGPGGGPIAWTTSDSRVVRLGQVTTECIPVNHQRVLKLQYCIIERTECKMQCSVVGDAVAGKVVWHRSRLKSLCLIGMLWPSLLFWFAEIHFICVTPQRYLLIDTHKPYRIRIIEMEGRRSPSVCPMPWRAGTCRDMCRTLRWPGLV